MADPSLARGAGPDEIRHPELPSTATSSHFVDFWSGRNSRVPWNRGRPVKPASIFLYFYTRSSPSLNYTRGDVMEGLSDLAAAGARVVSGASRAPAWLADIRQPDRRRGRSDRLVGLGYAVIVGFGAPPVDDGAATDRDAIGLGAQRFAHDGRKLGSDAGAPA